MNGHFSMLRHYEEVPEGFLNCGPADLQALLGGPSLFCLEGQRSPPLFITVLQHGNEPTGFEAVQMLLRKYQGGKLPRSVWLFVSNVAAAAEGQRVLHGQADYNRVWPGTPISECPETALMREVVETVTKDGLFASVDLHNNTGCNPHYGCVNKLDTPFLNLAALFARTVVFFETPRGVQSLAMAEHCPAVTLECGQAGENAALRHAYEYIDACLHLHHLPEPPPQQTDIHLLHTVAIVKMRPGLSFGFETEKALDVCFRPDLDHFNFSVLEQGATLAKVAESNELPVLVTDDAGNDISDRIFEVSDGALRTRCDIIPSMATLDTGVIKQDCLFYLMEEMTLPAC